MSNLRTLSTSLTTLLQSPLLNPKDRSKHHNLHTWWTSAMFKIKGGPSEMEVHPSRYLEYAMLYKNVRTKKDFVAIGLQTFHPGQATDGHLPSIVKCTTIAALRGMQRLQVPALAANKGSDWDDTYSHVLATVLTLPACSKLPVTPASNLEQALGNAWDAALGYHGSLEPWTRNLFTQTTEVAKTLQKQTGVPLRFSLDQPVNSNIDYSIRVNWAAAVISAIYATPSATQDFIKAISKTHGSNELAATEPERPI